MEKPGSLWCRFAGSEVTTSSGPHSIAARLDCSVMRSRGPYFARRLTPWSLPDPWRRETLRRGQRQARVRSSAESPEGPVYSPGVLLL